MLTKKAIVIEKRLADIFSYLPKMKNKDYVEFSPTFMYGNEKQLLDFLRQTKQQKSVYPLIWMVYPFEENHERNKLSFTDLTLVLAVETNSVMLNEQRIAETYKNVLMPLFSNIRSAFTKANIASITEEYKISKFPNYSETLLSEENKATYIWDAMRVSFSGYLTSNCLKPIYFN